MKTKFLAIFLFVGFTSAAFYDAVDDAENGAVKNFLSERERRVPLRVALNTVEIPQADVTEEEYKTELGKELEKVLNKILQEIKEALNRGEEVEKALLEKLQEVKNEMKSLGLELGDCAKQTIYEIKEKIREIFKNMLEKKVLAKQAFDNRSQRNEPELDLREKLRMLKKKLLEKISKEELENIIMKYFERGSELLHQFLRILKERGKEKLMDVIDVLLDNHEEERRKKSMSDLWERIKEYFKDLHIDLKEKYFKFGEWVKENFDKGLKSSKDQLETVKVIAQQFLKHGGTVSKEVGKEAIEFFRAYKDDLGKMWEEIKEMVKKAMNKE